MDISELETLASKGVRLDEDFRDPTRSDAMAAIEIMDKARDLLAEVQHGRWDKDAITSKTAAIIWFAAKIAGIYGVNLESAIRNKADEKARETPAADKPSLRFPMKKGNSKWSRGRPANTLTSARSTKTIAKPTGI